MAADFPTWPSPLPPLRRGDPPDAALLARRKAMATAPIAYAADRSTTVEPIIVGSVPCLRILPSSPPKGMVVHCRGGGFRLGSPDRSVGFASALAASAGCAVLLPRYRLAPEFPFPAALIDLETVLTELPGRDPLIISGDSAGGNIATVMALRHARRLGPALAGLLLFSPWLDLRLNAESFIKNADMDGLFSLASGREAAEAYVGDLSRDDALVSPTLVSAERLALLPAICLITGEGEVLLDDTIDFGRRSIAANVATEVHIIPAMQHVAATLAPSLPGATQALEIAVEFVSRQMRELSGSWRVDA